MTGPRRPPNAAAYSNPINHGDLAGVNFRVWSPTRVLADQKCMSIFSMLFGAGVCVFIDRVSAKPGCAAGLHCLRMFWLHRFRFGPLEWLWRALTYLKRPPTRV